MGIGARSWLPVAAVLPVALAATGAHAQGAIDCRNPATQLEITHCAGEDWKAADRELNTIYASAMALMRRIDNGLPADLKGAADTLRDAQRAWIPYRDRACDAYGFLARGGSMESQIVLSCRAELTRQRVRELNDLTQGLGN